MKLNIMGFKLSHSININCPQQTVFEFVTDFRNDTKWWKRVIKTEKLTEGDMGVDSEFLQYSYVMLGIKVRNHLKVLEYQPHEYVTYVNESPQLGYDLRYTFTPQGQELTTFTLDATIHAKRALQLFLPLTKLILKKQLSMYFAELKVYLETEHQLS